MDSEDATLPCFRASVVRQCGVPALALALALPGSGCATGRSSERPAVTATTAAAAPKKPERVDLPETVISVQRAELELVGMDEAQLFDCGTRAFTASDPPRAARCFDRLVGLFPDSQNWVSALYNAALAQEKMQAWPAALERWERYLARFAKGTPAAADEVDASFHAAFCEHEQGLLDAAGARLHALSEREGLLQSRRGEAMAQEAVCRIEAAGLARSARSQDPTKLAGRGEGERLLRAALALYEKAGPDGEADPGLLAQAEFWIGEVYRSYFQEVALDPASMAEKGLAEALETKAQFLLSAQGHYLRAIRKGDGEWATASGFRIGELYEELHRQMVAARVPADLTAEQARVYREELKQKVRVLLDKAMKVYEQTLATAQRVNARSAYVEKTSEALGRMRTLLLEERRPAVN